MAAEVGKGGRPKILAVDDDEAIVNMLKTLLARVGDVSVAGDGAEALEMIEGGYRPDLIVLDWMMPRLDGMGLVEKLQENAETAGLAVIMLTAKNTPDDLIAGMDVGVRDYITKPFNSEQLLQRVKEELGR
jgi:DNA-binding response OmpR family regulator